ELWPGASFLEDRSWLGLQEDGETPVVEGASIKATGPIRTAYGKWVYEGFYRWMDNETPYTYRGKQEQYGYLGRAYFDHGYDFRLSNDLQVEGVDENLLKKVNEVRTKTKSDKVILIAHSMGGYQARLFADKYPGRVKAIIFLSTPHHGAPKAYEALTGGYNFGVNPLLVTDYQVWGFARNWPGAYQLLPDFPFIQESDAKGNWTLEESFYGGWISYQAMEHYKAERWPAVKGENDVEKVLERELPRGLNSPTVAKAAQEFRAKFNAITLDKDIRLEIINGDNRSTTYEFRPDFKEEYFITGTVLISGIKLPYKVLRLTAVTEPRGDETVSLRGLQWDKAARTQTVNEAHGSVPNNRDAQRMMAEIFEEINHDKRDELRLTLINKTVERELQKLRDKERTEEAAKAYAEKVKGMEKQKEAGGKIDESFLNRLKGDLEGRARSIVFGELGEGKTYRINIIVPGAGQYDEKNPDFKAFVVVHEGRLVDLGIGTVKPQDAKVTVRDMDTFAKVTVGPEYAYLGGQGISLGEAYRQGLIEVDSGIVKNALLKAAELVKK
ncbi:MAG: alpha/beta fold hydrolase, partial [Candidatus Hydrothermarchaeota archaeon]